MGLENLPRFKLSHLNTPLETLERLRQNLSEQGISTPDRILIKRDDVILQPSFRAPCGEESCLIRMVMVYVDDGIEAAF